MLSKKSVLLLICILLIRPLMAQEQKEFSISMNKVKLSFMLDEKGTPVYEISYGEKQIIKSSQMGFVFSNNDNFNSGFEITNSEKKSVDETWKPVWGEVSTIRNHYEQIIFHLKQTNSKRLLDIDFKVFENGVGFRYEFPQQPNLKYFIVTNELTHFNLTGNHKTFWIPGNYDTNEYLYTTDLPENYEAHIDAFQFIKDVPVDWDDTKILEAEPGDYLTIARKEKGKSNWFIGAITDENSRVASFPLSFLDNGIKYLATIYADATDADWKDNAAAYTIKQFVVTNKNNFSLRLAKRGGTAVSIIPASLTELKQIKAMKNAKK